MTDAVLLFYIIDDDVGHLGVGINIENKFNGEFVTINNKKYYFCETTTPGYILGEKPKDITGEPTDKIVYTYLNFEITSNDTKLDDENFENLTINFKVRMTWIENNSIDKTTISLMRLNESEWE